VLADGLMKLHLSDYRARVLARFAGRLEALRAERATAARPSRAGAAATDA